MADNNEMPDDQIEDMNKLAMEMYSRMLQSLPDTIPTIPIMAALSKLVADVCIVMVEEAQTMGLETIPSAKELGDNFSKDLIYLLSENDQTPLND